jgi:hypothetical protein
LNRNGPDPARAAELATAAGCEIEQSEQLLDGSYAHRIGCRNHAAKVRLLELLAEHDSTLPDVRRLAELVAAGAADTAEQLQRLQSFVQSRVTFTSERDETFTATMRTLAHGLGDCDDSSRALMALVRSLGIPCRLRTLPDSPDAIPLHVAPQAKLDGRWIWLEPSIAAQLGEHPLAAARRLNIHTRPELGALNPDDDDEPESEIGKLHFLPEQWAAVAITTAAALGAMGTRTQTPLVPAALAAAGAVAAHAFTTFPLLPSFTLDDGHECSTFLVGVDEGGHEQQCADRYARIRLRNAAMGAGMGLLLGILHWRANK